MSVLIVCPTRGRPAMFDRMLSSFYATRSEGTELYAYVANDDPELKAYQSIAPAPGVMIGFGPRRTIVEVFNRAFELVLRPISREAAARLPAAWPATPLERYDYYVDCNDDFMFHTPGWDRKLMAAIEANGGHGCAYGRTRNLPSGAMFARRSIEALGWWFPPGFKHQFVDNVQRDLYSAARQLFYVDDVWIEHRHPLLGVNVAWDETYEFVYSDEVRRHDEEAYLKWRAGRAVDDVAKLIAANTARQSSNEVTDPLQLHKVNGPGSP